MSCARGGLLARGARAFPCPAAPCQLCAGADKLRTSVICTLGSTPAARATFSGTPCTTARPPARSRTARVPSVVPAGAAPAAAAAAGGAAIGLPEKEVFNRLIFVATEALQHNLINSLANSPRLMSILEFFLSHCEGANRRAPVRPWVRDPWRDHCRVSTLTHINRAHISARA